jgi:hypothetical protein
MALMLHCRDSLWRKSHTLQDPAENAWSMGHLLCQTRHNGSGMVFARGSRSPRVGEARIVPRDRTWFGSPRDVWGRWGARSREGRPAPNGILLAQNPLTQNPTEKSSLLDSLPDPVSDTIPDPINSS